MHTAIPKNNPRLIRAWCLYDWANSVYSLTIVSSIFPVYFAATARGSDGGTRLNLLGWEVENSVVFTLSLSLAFLIVAAISPLLSGIADYSGRKKRFMQVFCYLGSASCAGLFFFTPQTTWLGVALFILATIGYSGSIVFYNSYLADLVTDDQADKISARGFSYGYVGSVILLVLNLLPILQPGWFGNISGGLASRIAFLCTGLWWLGFAQITFRTLPEPAATAAPSQGYLGRGYSELQLVWQKARQLPSLRRYLPAYFFYNMGVQTVMYLAALFGEKELKLDSGALIATILVLQLIAIPGAWLTSRLSGRIGNKGALLIILVIWIGICIAAFRITTQNQFYALAAVVGLVMGGVQALSRATYAKLIPANETDTASYFSFYDVTEKLSIVLGTLAYAGLEIITGSMRYSSLALGLFFLMGIVLLSGMPAHPSLQPRKKESKAAA